jgi:hypothetical protein
MAFRDLDEFLVVRPIVLPIRGKDYAFPGEVSARSWLMLQRMNEQTNAVLRGELGPETEAASDNDEAGLRAEMFGDTAAEMVADGLTSAHMDAVYYTLLAHHLSGPATAQVVWEAQGEAGAPNRQDRRHPPAAKPSRPRGSRATSNDPKKPAPVGEPSSSTGT